MHSDHEIFNSSLSSHMSLPESGDLSHWCEELNLRTDELKDIVQLVGLNLHAVRDFLAKRSLNRESPFF